MPHPRPRTLATLGVALVVTLGAAVGSAGGKTSGVAITAAPHRAVQGNRITVRVSVAPAGGRCSISMRYADGSAQRGLGSRRATRGRASWTWRVPRSARPGPAAMLVSCAGAGSASRSIMIIGQLLPLRIKVVKTGFSTRYLPYGGTRVSYGLLLENESKTENAQNLSVLVNFVMADNRLIGSASTGLMEVRAEATHAVGGDITFPGGAPIERLEVVVQVGARAPRTRRAPAISAIRVVPDIYDPGWVGSVEGELANDDRASLLQSARLSAVVLDAQGNILGGVGGYAFASLPPGAREFFKLSGGLNAIPIGRAASAVVSVEPMYARD